MIDVLELCRTNLGIKPMSKTVAVKFTLGRATKTATRIAIITTECRLSKLMRHISCLNNKLTKYPTHL